MMSQNSEPKIFIFILNEPSTKLVFQIHKVLRVNKITSHKYIRVNKHEKSCFVCGKRSPYALCLRIGST